MQRPLEEQPRVRAWKRWANLMQQTQLSMRIFLLDCQSWCYDHNEKWPKKCTWPRVCDGCPECTGEWIDNSHSIPHQHQHNNNKFHKLISQHRMFGHDCVLQLGKEHAGADMIYIWVRSPSLTFVYHAQLQRTKLPPRHQSKQVQQSTAFHRWCHPRHPLPKITSECKRWCHKHTQIWRNKCNFKRQCDGCPKCFGKSVHFMLRTDVHGGVMLSARHNSVIECRRQYGLQRSHNSHSDH